MAVDYAVTRPRAMPHMDHPAGDHAHAAPHKSASYVRPISEAQAQHMMALLAAHCVNCCCAKWHGAAPTVSRGGRVAVTRPGAAPPWR
jgi:hypothetical protein